MPNATLDEGLQKAWNLRARLESYCFRAFLRHMDAPKQKKNVLKMHGPPYSQQDCEFLYADILATRDMLAYLEAECAEHCPNCP